MNKFVKVISVAAAGLALFAFSARPTNDNSFEGVIKYSIKVGGDVPPQYASMVQNMSSMVYIKGNKSRVEVKFGMGSSITISDRSTKQSVTLRDMMGKKIEVKNDFSKPSTTEKAPDVKLLDDTKTIAGYTCKHAQVTMTDKNGESSTTDVWYTNELPYSKEMGKIKGIDGFLMSFVTKFGPMTSYFTAESVTKQSVPDSLFVIPTSGYKVYNSDEEMMKDMQSAHAHGGDGE